MTSHLPDCRNPRAVPRLLAAATIFLLLWGGAPNAGAQPEEIRIDNPSAYGTKQRAAVVFGHHYHMDVFECLDCHHDYRDGRNVLDEADLEQDGRYACIRCHTDAASLGLQRAYHRQCITCHRTTNREYDLMLPVTCAGCHPKANQ